MNHTNKKTHIDLTNTYIENDFGELRDLYLKECKSQGYEIVEKLIDSKLLGIMTAFSRNGKLEGDNNYRDMLVDMYGLKKITLKDLKPSKPKTKVEYIPCNLSPSEIYTNMICGEEYYFNKHRMWFDGNQFWLQDGLDASVATIIQCIEDNHEICEKVERELEWFEDIPEGGILCWVCDYHKGNKNDISFVKRYSEGKDYPFICKEGITKKYATPFTKKEIQVFLDNAPE